MGGQRKVKNFVQLCLIMAATLHNTMPMQGEGKNHSQETGLYGMAYGSLQTGVSMDTLDTPSCTGLGVSKGVEDSRRSPTQRAGHPRNSHKAIAGVADLQGIEGSSMAGSGETLGSPWIPLAILARQEISFSFP
jgi:hypothetical protein